MAWRRSSWLLIAVGALGGPVAHAACPATSGDLAIVLARADSAYVAMDLDGFNLAVTEARNTLACLSLPVTPAEAAAFHRTEALYAYTRQEGERTVSAFRALLAVQPDYDLPATLAPPGNPLRDRFDEAARQPPSAQAGVRLPHDRALWVDGIRSTTRPVDRPAVIQLADDEGGVLWTGWLVEGDALPDLGASQAELSPDCRGLRINGPLLGGALASLVAGGVLYGVAADARMRFDDPATDRGDLDALRSRTNTAFTASAVAAGVGVGLGVAAVVTVQW